MFGGRVEDHGFYPKKAIAGREFVLTIGLLKNNGSHIVRAETLYEAVQTACLWAGKMKWTEVKDFKDKVIIPRGYMARLLAAHAGTYGTPTKKQPYEIRYLDAIHSRDERYTTDLPRAIYALTNVLDDGEEFPYWAELRAPNGRMLIARYIADTMYHAEMMAHGTPIVESLVRASKTEGILLADGSVIPKVEVLFERVLG